MNNKCKKIYDAINSTEKVREEVESVNFTKYYNSPYYKNPVPVYLLRFEKFEYNQMFPTEKTFEENIANSLLAYDRNVEEWDMIDLELKTSPLKKLGITKPKKLVFISCGDIVAYDDLTKEEIEFYADKKITKKRKKKTK